MKGENKMWKEYTKEKPTEEEHQYLVKEIVSNGTVEGLTLFHICGYSKNLSKVDDFDFYGKTSGGFYDYDSEFGYFVIDQTKFNNNKLYWIDLTEADKEWS